MLSSVTLYFQGTLQTCKLKKKEVREISVLCVRLSVFECVICAWKQAENKIITKITTTITTTTTTSSSSNINININSKNQALQLRSNSNSKMTSSAARGTEQRQKHKETSCMDIQRNSRNKGDTHTHTNTNTHTHTHTHTRTTHTHTHTAIACEGVYWSEHGLFCSRSIRQLLPTPRSPRTTIFTVRVYVRAKGCVSRKNL